MHDISWSYIGTIPVTQGGDEAGRVRQLVQSPLAAQAVEAEQQLVWMHEAHVAFL